MKVFIFEDDQTRINGFLKYLKGHDVFSCDNIEVAKMMLKDNQYDVAFLDHDMDHKSYVPSSEPNTGYQLAKFIVGNNIKFHQVFVHSMNPAGADNIVSELNNSLFIDEIHRVPFPSLISLLKGI